MSRFPIHLLAAVLCAVGVAAAVPVSGGDDDAAAIAAVQRQEARVYITKMVRMVNDGARELAAARVANDANRVVRRGSPGREDARSGLEPSRSQSRPPAEAWLPTGIRSDRFVVPGGP